jgi:hypothetical protein
LTIRYGNNILPAQEDRFEKREEHYEALSWALVSRHGTPRKTFVTAPLLGILGERQKKTMPMIELHRFRRLNK